MKAEIRDEIQDAIWSLESSPIGTACLLNDNPVPHECKSIRRSIQRKAHSLAKSSGIKVRTIWQNEKDMLAIMRVK